MITANRQRSHRIEWCCLVAVNGLNICGPRKLVIFSPGSHYVGGHLFLSSRLLCTVLLQLSCEDVIIVEKEIIFFFKKAVSAASQQR